MSDARTRWVGSCGIRWYDGGEANLSLVFLVASIWIPAATGSTALLQPSTDSAKAHCAAILTYTLRFFRCLTSSFQSIIMKFTSFAFLALAASASAFTQPASFGAARSFSTSLDVSKKDLEGAQTMIDKIIDDTNANPVFVRLAWHDSGTFDVNVEKEWPASGGAIGSIRFDPEINHGANAGLSGAVKLLEPVKESFPDVSFADIFQMASARSIELAGGPKIDMKYGML